MAFDENRTLNSDGFSWATRTKRNKIYCCSPFVKITTAKCPPSRRSLNSIFLRHTTFMGTIEECPQTQLLGNCPGPTSLDINVSLRELIVRLEDRNRENRYSMHSRSHPFPTCNLSSHSNTTSLEQGRPSLGAPSTAVASPTNSTLPAKHSTFPLDPYLESNHHNALPRK